MKYEMTRDWQLAFAVLVASFAVASDAWAAGFPKEGTYDYTACFSGVSNSIEYSKAYTASSTEFTGTIRTNPPAGLFDRSTFRCVGMNASLDGKASGMTVCESVDPDGDKRLVTFSTLEGKTTRQNITGTGKYEGMVSSGTVEALGPFPTIRAGTFQSCNHQTGTYKLK